jgi:hypothetical protein
LCRWLRQPDGEQADGLLEINGQTYELLPLRDGTALVGYRLRKPDGTLYDVGIVDPHGWTCDCPDATFHPERPGGCKHAAALRAALAATAK